MTTIKEQGPTAAPENRLDWRNVTGPEYVAISRDVRAQLQLSLKEEGWPPMPQDFGSVEDLFSAAKQAVSDRWKARVHDLMQEQVSGWTAALEPKRAEPGVEELLALLSKPEVLEERLELQQLRPFGMLAKQLPDAWRTLLSLSSER